MIVSGQSAWWVVRGDPAPKETRYEYIDQAQAACEEAAIRYQDIAKAEGLPEIWIRKDE